ncbi:hypothetical protein CYY_009112 [Polysphondylium violaceum]|uniref:YbaK/aminoacyl-tRNA synthetase-associated domain-containing protein n=1 Tax=Polysphondylium violaceum TaxID=133409 RepID=A0A8J4UPR3_9MYCE|nr:hypothetical protein CYY_009112 [Polysphondylium violaceum]
MSLNDNLITKQNQILSKLEELQKRLDNITASDVVTENEKRISNYLANDLKLDFKLTRVPSTYYDWTLEQRSNYLKTPSPEYLCKTIILENTECVNSDTSIQSNSRYYAVIIQYTTKIQSHKIFKFIKNINPQESSKKFHFRLAPPEVTQQMTGFEFNAVCPVGGNTRIPIIISKHIMDLPHGKAWLGGGEVDLKLEIDTLQFKQRVEESGTLVYVTDIIDPVNITTNSTTDDLQ